MVAPSCDLEFSLMGGRLLLSGWLVECVLACILPQGDELCVTVTPLWPLGGLVACDRHFYKLFAYVGHVFL